MRLRTPLSDKDVRALKVGDTATIDGVIVTGRDEVHLRALELAREGRKLPVDLTGAALFHAGPIMRKEGNGWKAIAAGPTTSSRMNSMEPEFIERFGIRAVIGKGGMSQPTIDAMSKFGCAYLAFTGGAAIQGAEGIREVKGVEWLDLGMPEAMWILEVKGFGPLTVAIDAHGNSLYKRVDEEVKANLAKVRRSLGI
ncbi:MAG: FumA C-terminus/TtdB family hydratase beta subunit [Methanomassiliicoccales archaeon]|nr:FumA C-terminus/TtdB family hydratase beta subunit [Methanomassiliicoccales archaeon]MDD1756910.1 FumA C-terminus/TtdB family hydratase beta subunit [Methanomassiliicoccales archaeon]